MTAGWAERIEASWTRGGLLAQLLRPVGALHHLLVTLRRALYRAGWLHSERLDVPVIVVGNRVAGGAGKTPTTLALVQALRQAGWHPGIVSRGHGGRATAPIEVTSHSLAADVGDEPLLLQRRSAVPLWIGRDRVAAARGLRSAHPDVDVLVCDDGLQHLRLQRDFAIVVFDERGAGNGRLLPAGPLREPVDAPSSARHDWVLYNCPTASTPLAGHCATRRLTGLVPLAQWWQGAEADPLAVAALRGQQVLATAGLGQPQRFFDALRALGLSVEPLALPDHYDYTELPWDLTAREVVLTEKDAVKLRPERLAAERPALRIWVAPLELTLPPPLIGEVLQRLTALRSARGSGAPAR